MRNYEKQRLPRVMYKRIRRHFLLSCEWFLVKYMIIQLYKVHI